MLHSRRGFVATFVVFAASLTLMATALAANPAMDTTTTNQDLIVEIMLDPAPGETHWLGEPLDASAWATLGEGDFANIQYVLDVSGSMENAGFNPFQNINPPGGIGAEDDCNGDGTQGSALDSACFGLIALNSSLGSAVNVDVGMVVFGDGAKTADMDPAGGAQAFTSPPDADNDAAGGPDVHQVIASADTTFGGSGSAGLGLFTADFTNGFAFATNYDAALSAMNAAFAAEPPGEINRAFFLSDGSATTFTTGGGSPLDDAVNAGTVVNTFGIGSIAPGSCNVGQDLRTIADSTGGTCTEVADPSTLSTVLPAALTNIASLDLEVNGTQVASTAGSEPVSLHLEDIDISGDVVPGLNTVEATGVAEDGTSVTADVEIEVVDMTLEPANEINELGADNEHWVTATLLGSPGVVSGRTITFEVTGQNPTGPTDVVTDGAGVAMFHYTVPVEPDSLGSDTISATSIIDDHEVTLEVTKDWVDTTPPVAQCVETVNPHGNQKPVAPGNGGQGQNQDGFYELLAEDDVWPADSLEIFVEDTGSGMNFGPFAVGTKIKWTEDDSAVPEIKKIGSDQGQGGAVDWHIIGNGDASVTAVDGSGNVSPAVSCLVPPPPK